MALVMLYVTHADKVSAEAMCSTLLKERLIACANLFDIDSMYRWNGELTSDAEVVSLLKTEQRIAEELEARIKELHSYDTPCIIRMPVSVNSEYERWVEEQCGDEHK